MTPWRDGPAAILGEGAAERARTSVPGSFPHAASPLPAIPDITRTSTSRTGKLHAHNEFRQAADENENGFVDRQMLSTPNTM
jgi:hypothetical protein